jgi:hypothetical protein
MALISTNARSNDVVLPNGEYDAIYKKLLLHEPEDDDLWISLIFDVVHDGEEVEKALHTSKILSMYEERQSSKLGKFFQDLGLEEAIDRALNAQGELASGDIKLEIGELSEEEEEDIEDVEKARKEQIKEDVKDLRAALKGVLSGKKLKLLIVTDNGDDGEEKNKIERAIDWEELNPSKKSTEQEEGGQE